MQKRRPRFNGAVRPKGMFADNVWHCDCEPRLPAEHFRVKKAGKNNGRWFYTCQQQEPNRCGFFLWDEVRICSGCLLALSSFVYTYHNFQDAAPREAATVMSNKRSEPQQIGRGHSSEPQQRGKGLFSNPTVKLEQDEALTTTPSPSATPQSGSKRSPESAGFDLSDENDLFTSYETPQAHKVQKIGIYATPATSNKGNRKLPWLEQQMLSSESSIEPARESLATPSKPPSKTLRGNPSTPIVYPELADSLKATGPPESPSPLSRYKDALASPADSASSLTSEVLANLSGVLVPAEKMATLRTILSRHDLKAYGVAKGRDISRLALKAKEAKIVELQHKIARLDAEREVDRGIIQKLRWEKQHYQHIQADDDFDEDEVV